jgi:MoaA/NifB/PqqE/SkfB family radical SAM enzyme
VSGNGAIATQRLRRLRWAQTYLRGGPVAITWDLSPCGIANGCLVCDQEGGLGGEWATRPTCGRVISELSRFGTLVVGLVGGRDPFLHPDLAAIVKELVRAHLPVVVSSGWGVTVERAKEVWDAGLVEAAIALHTADPTRHDAEVGWPGAHARALRALRVLAETRRHTWQRVSASVTLGAEGASGVAAVLDLVEGLGASVIVEPPFGRHGHSTPGGVGSQLTQLRRQRGMLRNSAAYLARIDQAMSDGVSGCKAGRRSLHLDQRGRVFRCMDLAGAANVLGDIVSESVDSILPRLRRGADCDGCRECWRAVRGEVECLGTWRGLWSLSSWLWS